jgi:hypothetical protein
LVRWPVLPTITDEEVDALVLYAFHYSSYLSITP